ncbi:MAG: ATP-binding protein [Chitinophagales bacterium]
MKAVDFRKLFEAAPSLFMVLDANLNLVAFSDAYTQATKIVRENVLGKHLFEVFPDNPNDSGATGVGNLRSSCLRVLTQKEPDAMAVQKYDIQKPESEGGGWEVRYWSVVNVPVLNAAGEVEYILHKAEDVTEFMRLKGKEAEAEELQGRAAQMELEVYNRAQQLQQANQQLREAEKGKTELFANVSHELRTPLSLILAPLETLLSGTKGALNNEQTELLHTMHNNGVRLLQMVTGLLDFTKTEAGKMQVHREVANAAEQVATLLKDFDPQLKSRQLTITTDLTSASKPVFLDRYLLERILFNLLSNAIKFTPAGGSISVKAMVQAGRLRLEVSDTGIGISEKELPLLFQKFKQVEGSSVRRFEGTGLGLAMVKEFAELQQGFVEVHSVQGKGSTFIVDIAAPEAGEAVVTESAVPRNHLSAQFKGIEQAEAQPEDTKQSRILVCEDNEELSAYITSVLKDFCQVKTAANGKLGLELVRTWKPDLVLSDVMMPEMDGVELCRAIKASEEFSGITIVLLTALSYREAMLRGWEAGADEYLFKPFHPQELTIRIRSLLALQAERKRLAAAMEQKNRELELVNTELEAFSYSIAHDLRAPLRAINGCSKIVSDLLRDKIDRETEHLLDAIAHNSSSMGVLIDDLLTFSRMGKQEMKKRQIDLNELVKEVLANVLRDKTVKPVVYPLPSIKGDASMMRQVYINLIGNAVKYSSKKDNPIIEIGVEEKEGKPVFYVRDNGAGFDMRYYNKLFGVFQRLHGAGDFEGTGVGLALVKRIVTRHGGDVWAEGKVNEGATFYFTLSNCDKEN